MALKIRKTGFDDYLDGSANIKMLVIGGPGVGKTRSASYWPRPFFIDCENGRGSLADRKVPYVEVKSSKDMLDALAYLKDLERLPKSERQYQTVVVDTLDSFQRSVKDEWLQANNAGVFKGWDAWGFMNTKVQMLMTRLLNLDYNVIVNVHYKDKTFKDDDGNESRELELQLQGDIKDSAFNDFGLVGMLGTYFEYDPEVEERVQRRGITFTPTPERPFLKDRFNITGKWWPIAFSDQDYSQFSLAFAEHADGLPASEEVGEVPDATTWTPHVVPPTGGGPVGGKAPTVTKADLIAEAEKLGLKVKGNALKAEIIAAIEEAKRSTEPTPTSVDSGAEPAPAPADSVKLDPPTVVSDEAMDVPVGDTEADQDSSREEPGRTPEDLIKEELGGRVIAEYPAEEPPKPAPVKTCDVCGKDLAAENQDRVQLAWIKFRKKLCNLCYAEAKK